jgi:Xylose isomerase-like TIM barrel.
LTIDYSLLTKFMHRRSFIKNSSLVSSAIAMHPLLSLLKEQKLSMPVSIFSKNLQWLSVKELSPLVKEMGFDGVDLTVRPNGHILPERVTEDLPKALAILKDNGLAVYCITTAITDVTDSNAEAIIKTAASAGIKYFRMGWYNYSSKISVTKNLDEFKEKISLLHALNKIYEIQGCYQNHAGEYFGSSLWDLYSVLKDFDPQYIGCQFDIRHATVEAAHSWPISFDLLKNYIKTINVKDFYWLKKDNKWVENNVPLGTGMVDFKKYFQTLSKNNFHGPVCIHYEYPLGGAEDGAKQISISKGTVLESMKTDLQTLRKMMLGI